MKTGVGAWVFWVLAVLWVSGAPAPGHAGGEIGNARYIRYASLVGEFETRYPRSWDRLDVGPSVSFVEKLEKNGAKIRPDRPDPQAEEPVVSAAPPSPSAVNIAMQSFEEVRTVEDLERYLQFFQFERKWEPVELAGRPGFRSVQEGKGAIYLLRAEGELALIRYQARVGDELAEQDVRVILESLKFAR